jgi:uncharacterized protein DUF547
MSMWKLETVAARAALLAVLLPTAVRTALGGTVDHTLWDTIVKQYVDDGGRVAYQRLRTESGDALAVYLKTLAAAAIDDLPSADRLAFWINAYNATIVAGVLEDYSPESSLSRLRFFRIYSHPIAGASRTPDDIEAIVRSLHDSRVHFALVCASTSCPKLRREAYLGARLDAQLDDQARQFVNDPDRNRIDPATGAVELSMIFDWFKDDFRRDGRALADFLAPYLNVQQVELLREKAPRYRTYDWTMNAQPGQRP